jgi:hypothetical protein
MTQQHLLPKFGPGKAGDADAPPTAGSIGNAATEPVVSPEVQQNEGMPMNVAENHPIEEQTITAAGMRDGSSGKIARAGGPTDGQKRRVPSYWLGWVRRKNPFRPKPTGRKGPEPLQGELLLESITVMRNDLTETDLEVVPGAQVSGPRAAAEANPERARFVWRRIMSRLFGIRRS